MDYNEFDEYEDDFPTSQPDEKLCFKVIGEPLVQLKPFAAALDSISEGVRCKACFSKIEEGEKLYCSTACLAKEADLQAIDDELESDKGDELKNELSNYEEFITEHLFNTLNRLCIRVLYCDKQRSSSEGIKRYDASFLPETVSYDDISFRFEVNELGPLKHPMELLEEYSGDYDMFTEEKRQEMDEILGIAVPSDSFIREAYYAAQSRKSVESLLDSVQEELEPYRRESQPRSLSFGDDSDYCSSIPADTLAMDISSHIQKALTNRGDSSQAERYQEIFSDYRHQNPGFDLAQIEGTKLSDEEAIANYKREYRICSMDVLMFSAEHTDKKRTPDDRRYGDWVRELRKFIDTNEVAKQILGDCSWDDILKAFSVTIRYSVGMQDFLGSNAYGQALYLPLVEVEHSCTPTCSYVFDDQLMSIFYKPEKEITVKQDENCNTFAYLSNEETILHNVPQPLREYLPLTDRSKTFVMSISFMFESLFSNEKHYTARLTDFRAMKCTCGKCFGQNSAGDNMDPFGDNNSNDYDYNMACSSQLNSQVYFQDDDQDETIKPEDDDQEDFDAYDSTVNSLQLLATAGRQNEPHFSSSIQSVLDDAITYSREVSGFYHPRITGFLFYSLSSKFRLISHESNNVLRFYKYLAIDKFLGQILDSVSVTHGKHHSSVTALEKVHELCHTLLGDALKAISDKLGHLEPVVHRQLLHVVTMFSGDCSTLHQLDFNVCSVNWNSGSLYNKEEDRVELDDDDSFLPDFESSHNSSGIAQGRKRKHEETDDSDSNISTLSIEDNNLPILLKHLNSIFDIDSQHYL